MNLQSCINKVASALGRAATTAGFFGQTRRGGLFSSRSMMSQSFRLPTVVFCAAAALASAISAFAQTNYYTTNGLEFSVAGSLPGDQVFPDAAISSSGGFVVWQDNATDGDGWGISARSLTSLANFRVNATGAGSQENPRVALLKSGGAVFVWQGGTPGLNQHIYARFLTSSNTFVTLTNDVQVNTFAKNFQVYPAVTVLNNSNVVVVWSSYNQAGSNSMQDIYGQVLSPTGQKIGGEFLVNSTTAYNQRNPVVAALANGGFVAGWISEQQRTSASAGGTVTLASVPAPSVDCYARLFNNSGVATTGEFLVNTGNNPCAMPALAAGSDGGYLFVWGERDLQSTTNGWDIFARPFSSSGTGGTVALVNAYQFGDQFSPRVSALGQDYLVAWTSMAQDGSGQGVYGRFVHSDGSFNSGESRVNTTTANNQMQPALAADGVNQFIVVWTSFTGAPNTFDLFAQRYINVSAFLSAMSAPYVWAPFVVSNNVYQPRLVVSWVPQQGLSVSNYEVYVDGATSPAALVISNQWTMTAANGLTVNSTHSFQLDYVTTDGRRSPISPSASGTTWQGYSWGGIPFEWMTLYYGGDISQWPSAGSKPSSSGSSVYQIFLSGGNPTDASTWLKTAMSKTSQGMFLTWNTQPGATYQVQMTTNLVSWSNVGSPRFAAGTTDSINVGSSTVGYYRVVLLR